MTPLPAPPYTGPEIDPRPRVGLTTAANKLHVTDEAWQLFAGLEHAGYALCGWGIDTPTPGGPKKDWRCVPGVLWEIGPGVVAVQDRRETDGLTAGGRRCPGPDMRLIHLEVLRDRPDVFKVGVVKDAQSDGPMHRAAAEECGTHAWITYYSPETVCRLAPFVRRANVVRTWHTLDPAAVPPYSPAGREGCLLSGAVSAAYPLRQRLIREIDKLPGVRLLKHPGYHRNGCQTPAYIQGLAGYKAAICTASVYGYALRKLIEATAAGCVVITDLPASDPLPEIDGNLIRVRPDIPTPDLADLLRSVYAGYDPERQRHYAARALEWYDYRSMGVRLAADIEILRRGYNP